MSSKSISLRLCETTTKVIIAAVRPPQVNVDCTVQNSTFHWQAFLGKPDDPTIHRGFYLGKLLLFSVSQPDNFTSVNFPKVKSVTCE